MNCALKVQLPITKNFVKFFWVQDHIRAPSDVSVINEADGNPVTDPTAANNEQSSNVVSEYVGALYHGSFVDDIIQVSFQWASQTGSADNTGIFNAKDLEKGKEKDDYDIDASMMFFNITSGVWKGSTEGTGGRLGLSYLWTSGDGDDDSDLNGFTGVTAGQRFSQQFGGEHSILGEQNVFVLGNQLYGFIRFPASFDFPGTKIFSKLVVLGFSSLILIIDIQHKSGMKRISP